MGKNPHSLSSLVSFLVHIFSFDVISTGKGELIFNVPSWTLLLFRLKGLSVDGENENNSALINFSSKR